MSNLFHYAKALVEKAGHTFVSGDAFAKVLTSNDDSGRHGVLIPSDGYSFFPNLPIPDPKLNTTSLFAAYDSISSAFVTLAYKYYERYPERRITRLPGILNDLNCSPRLVVFIRTKHSDGSFRYYFDCANSTPQGRFFELFNLIFGSEITPDAGKFVIRPVDSDAFSSDPVLEELLGLFDIVKQKGWLDSLRPGDTGIGYTFETLLNLKENNDQRADFKGIEIKCMGLKEGETSHSKKTNLFQAGPTWLGNSTSKDRIRILGNPGQDGLYSCYSQITVTPNNLGLLLDIMAAQNKINLRKNADELGHWTFGQLAKRLAEKHSRAIFVRARVRKSNTKTQYAYDEVVYCEKPSIERFVDLVAGHNIVFEFTMSEKPNGSIRNHGYPWRLIRAEFLDQLFTFQIKLR